MLFSKQIGIIKRKMLSVIIPFYNSKKYIKRCIDSLKAQLLKEVEFIFVDDGSTDGGYNECITQFCNDSRFLIVRKENGGTMSAWLEGLNHVKGNYLGFVDVDDYIEPDMFLKMYQKAIEYNTDIVMCSRNQIYKDIVQPIKGKLQEGYYIGDSIDIVREIVFPNENFKRWANSRWDKIYKTDLYKANTKYITTPVRFAEDLHIVPACMLSAKSFYYIDETLYNYVQIKGSASSKPAEGIYEGLKDLHKSFKNMLIDNDILEKYTDHLERMQIILIEILLFRNMRKKGFFQKKLEILRKLKNDSEYKEAVQKYSHRFNIRDKIVLWLLYRLNSQFITLIIWTVVNNVIDLFSVFKRKYVQFD